MLKNVIKESVIATFAEQKKLNAGSKAVSKKAVSKKKFPTGPSLSLSKRNLAFVWNQFDK